MGGTLTAGFYTHDFHYSKTYLGFTAASVIFLISLFIFHTVAFLIESKFCEIAGTMNKIMFIVLRIGITIATSYAYLHEQQLIEGANISLIDIFAVLIIIFPEALLRIVFSLRRK